MKIGVLAKRVPDTEARVSIGADGKSIDESGIEFIISPYDEIAGEVALQLKEKHGGEVVVVCYGPKEAATVVRKALAMGADRAVLITESTKEHEPAQTAKVLSSVLKEENFDLILAGRQAIDDDSAQVGPMLSELLELPCVTDASKLEVDPAAKKAVVHKEIEGGEETVEVPIPAIITCQKGLAEPRLPSLKGIMMAKRKPLKETQPAEEPEVLAKIVKMEYPPKRPPGRIIGEGTDAVGELIRLLKEEAKIL